MNIYMCSAKKPNSIAAHRMEKLDHNKNGEDVMTPQERLAALVALLELINEETHPSNKTIQRWLRIKDSLSLSPGRHHASRDVTRGQVRGDVERLIESVSKMVAAVV